MSGFIDLTGRRFGNLVVLNSVPNEIKTDKQGTTYWMCRCDCGKEHLANGVSLRRGHTTSCGCKQGCLKHGLRYTRLYHIWDAMVGRCFRKSHVGYTYYGGRGITLCDEWLGENGFINFYNWAMGNGYQDNLTIDRIDVNGNYEPSNCRWTTMKEQSNNKRNNRYLTFNNKTQSMKKWSEELHITYQTISARLDRLGWSVEKTLSTPIQNKKNT